MCWKKLVKLVNECFESYLENQHPSVRHRQAEFGALSVLSRVQTDAIHLQPAGDFQQLVVGHGGSLSAAEEECQRAIRISSFS